MEKFTKVRNIGKGNMGACALARNNEDGRYYVIKQVDLAKLNKKERQQSLNEAKVLSALRHPNVINYYDSFLARKSDHLCIVMEYADGGDLSQRIKNNHGINFTETQVLDWFIQSVLSLHYVHQRKILHRDVKTQNIFLTQENLCKLGDFGIARTLSSTYDQASTFVGTPYYLSPELILERPYDHMSDVWALGVVLYELMTLKHPFNANDMKSLMHRILKVQYEPPPTLYSNELRSIVSKILVKDPMQRIRLGEVLELPIVSRRIRQWIDGGVLPGKYVTALLRSKALPPSMMAYAMQQSAVIAAATGGPAPPPAGGASSPSHAQQAYKSSNIETYDLAPQKEKAISPSAQMMQAADPSPRPLYKNNANSVSPQPPPVQQQQQLNVQNSNLYAAAARAPQQPVNSSRPTYGGGSYDQFANVGGGGGYVHQGVPPVVASSSSVPSALPPNRSPERAPYNYKPAVGGAPLPPPPQQQQYRRESEDILLGGRGGGYGGNIGPSDGGYALRRPLQQPMAAPGSDVYSRNPPPVNTNRSNYPGGYRPERGNDPPPPLRGGGGLPALNSNNNNLYRAYQAQQEFEKAPRSLAPVVVHGQGGIAPPPLRPNNMGVAYGAGGGGVAAAMHGYRGGGGGLPSNQNAIQQHNNDIQLMLQRAAQERAQRQKMFR